MDVDDLLARAERMKPLIRGHTGLGLAASMSDVRQLIADLAAAVRDLSGQVHVPGLWRCAECDFQLTQRSLRASDGAVGERDAPGERCPNCDVPLQRVSEREQGDAMAERCARELGRAQVLQTLLDDKQYVATLADYTSTPDGMPSRKMLESWLRARRRALGLEE